MGAQRGFHFGKASPVERNSKSLKKPHLWFGFKQCCCAQKPAAAASPAQENERESKGLSGEGEKEVMYDNRADGDNPTVITLTLINQRGSINRDARP